MPDAFVAELENTRATQVAFQRTGKGGPSPAIAEIVSALARTDNQPWRFDFRTGSLDTTEDWVLTTGSGHTVTTSAGNLVITTGTTASTTTTVRSKRAFTIPVRALAAITLSQRIANQEFYFELVNLAGDVFARYRFDGTTNTLAKNEVGVGALAANQTLNVTSNINATSGVRVYELDCAIDEVNFRDRAVDSSAAPASRAQRTKNIPHPDDDLYLQFRAVNLGTAPATSTTMTIDYGFVQDEFQLAAEIAGGRGVPDTSSAIPIVGVGGSVGLNASTNRIGHVANHGVWFDTSTTALGIGASTTPTTRDLYAVATATPWNVTTGYPQEYRAIAISDVAGDLFLEVSRDNATWRRIKQVTASNTGTGGLYVAEIEHKPKMRYARIVYTNGATAQAHFTLEETLMAA